MENRLSQLHHSIWGQIRPFFAGFRFFRKSPTFNQVCQLAAKLDQRKNHRIWPPKRVMQLARISLFLMPCFLCALPEAGKVVSGEATFVQSNGETLLIHAADKTILHFPKFHIAENEAVQFIQPRASSTVLNRVTGNEPSQILGRLSS